MIEPGIFISEFLKQIASPAHTKKNYGKRKLSNLHSQFCVHLSEIKDLNYLRWLLSVLPRRRETVAKLEKPAD